MRLMFKQTLCAFLFLLLPFAASAIGRWPGSVPVQFGAFSSSQGKAQNVNILDRIGNYYSTNDDQWSGLFGLGYYVDGYARDRLQLSYGVNAFYLGQTSVSGTILSEGFATNYSYSYHIQTIPVYAAVKALLKTNSQTFNKVTFDVGMGPDFMYTSGYHEQSLGAGSIADSSLFKSHHNTTFTATVGVGLQLGNLFGSIPTPFECGYRFFYLGQGQLSANSDQLLNTIKTGDVYANAIICSVTL